MRAGSRALRASRKTVEAPPAASPPPFVPRAAYALLAALLALLPLVFDPRLAGSFRSPKLYFAELVGLASLALLAAGGRLGPFALARSEAARALLPLFAVAAALAPTSGHPAHVRPVLLSFAIGVACLVGWSVGLGAERLRPALRWLLPAAGATGALGLTQALGWFQPFGVATEGVRGAERLAVIGLAGNPGDLGASLVLPALIAQAELARRRSALALFGLAGCVLGIAATQTMSALLALLVGSALIWGTGVPRRRLPRIVALLLAALAVTALAIAPARERLAEKWRDVRSGDWNATLTGRLDGWRIAAEIFRAHPWTGAGLGAFRAEFADAKDRLLERGVEFFPAQQHPVFANAHSEPLDVAAELGLPGLLALAWALWRIGRAARGLAGTLESREVGLGRAGLAALAILGLVGFPFRVALVAYPALAFLAWVFAVARRPEESEAEPKAPGGPKLWRGLLAVALAVATFARFQGVRQELQARWLLRSVELRTGELDRAGRLEPQIVRAHLAALEDAARRDPSDVAIRIARGNQLLALGSLPAALEAYDEAQELERRPETHLNRGQALALSGCDLEARVEWTRALRLDPTLAKRVPAARGGPLGGDPVFASGFECGVESWSAACGVDGSGCGGLAGGG